MPNIQMTRPDIFEGLSRSQQEEFTKYLMNNIGRWYQAGRYDTSNQSPFLGPNPQANSGPGMVSNKAMIKP